MVINVMGKVEKSNLVIGLLVDRVDMVKDGCNSEAFISLYKSREGGKKMTFEEILKELKPEHLQVVNAEIAKYKEQVVSLEKACSGTKQDLKKAEEDLEAAKEEVAKSKKPDPINEEEIIKSLDPKVQAIIKKSKEAQKAAEEVAKALNFEKEEQIAKERVTLLKGLPNVDDAGLLNIAKTATPEIFEVLKSAAKLITDGEVFKAVGSSAPNDTNKDAWAQIEAKADALRKDKPELDKSHAITEVIKTNPDLYKKYRDEVGGVK